MLLLEKPFMRMCTVCNCLHLLVILVVPFHFKTVYPFSLPFKLQQVKRKNVEQYYFSYYNFFDAGKQNCAACVHSYFPPVKYLSHCRITESKVNYYIHQVRVGDQWVTYLPDEPSFKVVSLIPLTHHFKDIFSFVRQ